MSIVGSVFPCTHVVTVVHSASVVRHDRAEGKIWFTVFVTAALLSDGSAVYTDGHRRLYRIRRRFSDFKELHNALVGQLAMEIPAKGNDPRHLLPQLPRVIVFATRSALDSRVTALNGYLECLLKLPSILSRRRIVLEWFGPWMHDISACGWTNQIHRLYTQSDLSLPDVPDDSRLMESMTEAYAQIACKHLGTSSNGSIRVVNDDSSLFDDSLTVDPQITEDSPDDDDDEYHELMFALKRTLERIRRRKLQARQRAATIVSETSLSPDATCVDATETQEECIDCSPVEMVRSKSFSIPSLRSTRTVSNDGIPRTVSKYDITRTLSYDDTLAERISATDETIHFKSASASVRTASRREFQETDEASPKRASMNKHPCMTRTQKRFGQAFHPIALQQLLLNSSTSLPDKPDVSRSKTCSASYPLYDWLESMDGSTTVGAPSVPPKSVLGSMTHSTLQCNQPPTMTDTHQPSKRDSGRIFRNHTLQIGTRSEVGVHFIQVRAISTDPSVVVTVKITRSLTFMELVDQLAIRFAKHKRRHPDWKLVPTRLLETNVDPCSTDYHPEAVSIDTIQYMDGEKHMISMHDEEDWCVCVEDALDTSRMTLHVGIETNKLNSK